ERGDGCGSVAKGGVTGNVVDLLAADIDDAPVTQRFQVLLARAQHRPLLMSAQNSSMSGGPRNRPVLRLRRACPVPAVWTPSDLPAVVFCLGSAASFRRPSSQPTPASPGGRCAGTAATTRSTARSCWSIKA